MDVGKARRKWEPSEEVVVCPYENDASTMSIASIIIANAFVDG